MCKTMRNSMAHFALTVGQIITISDDWLNNKEQNKLWCQNISNRY